MSELTRNESVESLQSRTSTVMAKKGQWPTRAKSNQQQVRGRKRALAEKTPEKRDSNVMIEEQPQKKATAAAAADIEVKEKIMNAKLSKADGKKPRAKSPEGGIGARGKRASAAVLHVEESSQSSKRPRTRSQTEESIPSILER